MHSQAPDVRAGNSRAVVAQVAMRCRSPRRDPAIAATRRHQSEESSACCASTLRACGPPGF